MNYYRYGLNGTEGKHGDVQTDNRVNRLIVKTVVQDHGVEADEICVFVRETKSAEPMRISASGQDATAVFSGVRQT